MTIIFNVGKSNIVITKGDESYRFPATKGLLRLAEILSHPGEELSCVSLSTAAPERVFSKSIIYDCRSVFLLRGIPPNPVMDQKYINECKKELLRLVSKKSIYLEYNDLVNSEKTQAKIDAIIEILQDAFLPGKQRSKEFGNEYTKSKRAVAVSLYKAFELVKMADSELGDCLQKSVRIGYYNCYFPDSELDIVVR